MAFSLLNTLILLSLFADMLERRYPDNFKCFIINLSFNCIYIYSKSQILFHKAVKNLNDIIENNHTLLKIKNEINNILIQNVKKVEIQKSEYGFSILSVLEDNILYKKIIYNDEHKDNIEHSDIKFLLLELYIQTNKYKIDLKTDKFNYYVVGNKFTKEFFIFYIKNHLNINNDVIVGDKCSLKFIDNNVNTFDIDFTDKNESLLLLKNGYNIVVEHSDN